MARQVSAPANGKARGSGPDGRITRDDIAAKLRSLSPGTGGTPTVARGAKTWAMAALVGAVVVGAYVAGRRRGRRGRAVIEITRI